jgi:PAS domain S-box-containing protein
MDEQLDTAPCGLLTLAGDGTIRKVNATLLNLLGRDREEVEGQHVESILSADARTAYQTRISPQLQQQHKAGEVYLPLRSAGGNEVPALIHAVRRQRDGAVVDEWAVMPVRERTRHEDELIHVRQQFEDANEARSRFFSMMSHDLRSPLSTISIMAQVLYRGGRGPVTEEQEQDLRRIESASQYVLSMIGDMVTYARMEAGQIEVRLEDVTLERLLAHVEALLTLQLEEAALEYARESCESAVVRADPTWLQQILLSLLANAIKFTDRGGYISVACEHIRDSVHIRVRDTGGGIAADQLERIFEPFTQAERSPDEPRHEGIGLGLAISRELARAMGGEVTAESTPGEGSVFTVVLPAAEPSR